MKKKKLTNKEITEILEVLGKNIQTVNNKVLYIDNLLGLYLEYRQNTEDFGEFVKARAEEFEKQKRSENKEGT